MRSAQINHGCRRASGVRKRWRGVNGSATRAWFAAVGVAAPVDLCWCCVCDACECNCQEVLFHQYLARFIRGLWAMCSG